jgi:hypothetical protein
VSNEDSIFDQALTRQSPQERAEFLDRACPGNPKMREEIKALLEAHEQAAEFLQSPPKAFMASGTIDFQAQTPQATDQAGSVVGPYKLLQQIGEGGMGVVFMAEQLRPVHRRVALKIIKPGPRGAGNPPAVARQSKRKRGVQPNRAGQPLSLRWPNGRRESSV